MNNKIQPLHPHYSFPGTPSVFDEDSMTALEMCGKLAYKVNEIIKIVNGYEVPKIVNVSPTGDETGELDRATIQGKLDSGYAVHLSAGEYYLNGPLIFRPGYMLTGDSQLNTVINCKAGFVDHEAIVSVDHVELRDIRVKGPGNGVGIDISRKAEGVETGGRYAHFLNVYISGYETGFRLGGCWCTNLSHCRIEASGICVEQAGSCNNVKYEHCMFLGPGEGMAMCGVNIGTENGAENYGIRFEHCDFERLEVAIEAYCCVSLNVSSIYAEAVDIVFVLDSCPGFLCDGGYISYPHRVCNTGRSNTASVFSKCGGAIRNIYVRVNATETFYLVSTDKNAPLNIEDISCVNDGTGECFVNAQFVNSLWNGHEHQLALNTSAESKGDLRYSYRPFDSSSGAEYVVASFKNKANHRFKVQSLKIINTTTFTASKATTFKLTIPGLQIGRDTNDRVTLMEAYLEAGKKYNAGINFTFTPVVETYRDLMVTDLTGLLLAPSSNDFTDIAVTGQLYFTIASGEMIL